MFDVPSIIKKIEDKGLKCSTVEKALGFGNGAIKRWATNSPSIVKVYKLSNFLNIPLCELLDEQCPETKKASPPALAEDEAKALKYYKQLDSEEHRDYIKGEMIRLHMAEEAEKQDTEFSDELAK
jgi:transcriptional regulator with XRE-family HTH domain